VRWISTARELLRGLLFRAREEAEMDEELRFHLEMETERLMREAGLERAEAARRAAIAFGGVEKHKDAMRDASGLAWVTGMSLDFKLGLRMLVKYPGLTLVGGLAIAFAIATGAATFEFLRQVTDPTLPLRGGDRLVGIRTWDAAANRMEPRVVHDAARWKRELRYVRDVGAFRDVDRNLILADGRGEPVRIAEISASGFRVADVPALLGRTLAEADEEPGAPPVVVIGHDLWRSRFGGDAGVVGRTVRLGAATATVVGVMPPGFAFPVAHGVWTPLPLAALDGDPALGPAVRVFGRLAPGATLAQARAEMAALARRAAAEHPETHARLRPAVMPYADSFRNSGMSVLGLMSINVFLLMLLVLVFGNVALLVFARAATREAEVTVRTALGASRGRITMQLVAEALVLGGAAAAVGLAVAGLALRWGLGVLSFAEEGRLPFWFSDRLSAPTLLYAAALTVLCAVIAGVIPALKVTRGIEARLRQTSAGGGGVRFGGVWTAVIVAQVAVTVAFPVTAYITRRDGVQIRALDAGFAADRYLSTRLQMDREGPPGEAADTSRAAYLARFRAASRELERRLDAEPAVAGVTFATLLPTMDHPQRRVEVDGGGAAAADPAKDAAAGERVSSASVAPNYFEVLGAPILSGRGFNAADAEAGGVAVVNQAFVRQVLGGRNPVGRRVRFVEPEPSDEPAADTEPGPWLEIVGVVKDLAMTDGSDPAESGAGFYLPAAPGAGFPVRMAVQLRGDPASFAPRLRAVATSVDPRLRLDEILRLDRVQEANLRTIAFWFRVLMGVSAMALLLSLAGIYSVMAFAVSRRTREIGIRVALGASRWRVVAPIFARPLRQVAIGVAAGGVLTAALLMAASEGGASPRGAVLLAAHMALMLVVCMFACVVPTRRALRIQPTEALRADA
jgi:putative ABC transport system permease protein